MKAEELDALAARVAEGIQVDWASAESSAGNDEERRVLRELQVLERIAGVHDSAASWREAAGVPAPGAWAHLRLLEEVGSGSYGQVYRAWDTRLDREVALKLLHDPGRGADDFLEEARRLARVRHPNVVMVFGAERVNGRVGLWMEHVHGETLEELLHRTGPLGAAEAVLVGITLCRALSAVHRAGLVHGDIKAQNVMRERGGRIVLMDFSASRELPAGEPGAPRLAGTPLYLAPEVLRGDRPSVRSDIYSFGVLLYHLVTGQHPVRGATLTEVRDAHARGEIAFLHDERPDLPEGFVRAVERALAPNPQQRYDSAGEVEAALAHALGFRPEHAAETPRLRRWRSITAVLAVAAGVAAVAFTLGRDATGPPPAFERLTFRHGRVVDARFTPDGSHVVYSADFGGAPRELYTTALGTLESRPLDIREASLGGVSSRNELALLLRPRFVQGYVEAGTLARVALTGGGIRELVTDVQSVDWSPDGEELAIVRAVAGRTRLEFPIGTVLYETGGWIGQIKVARDASSVAFLDHPTLSDDSGRVALVGRDKRVRHLTDRWTSARGIAWSPSGKELWFAASALSEARALRAVSMDGRQRIIHRGPATLRLHDISASGDVLVTDEENRVSTIALAPGAQRESDQSWLDWSLVRDLSADGRLLLFTESGAGGGANYSVYLRALDGSPAVRLGEGSGIALSPDARWALARLPGPPPRLALLPTRAGEPILLPGGLESYHPFAAWLPDGKRFVFAANARGHGSRLYLQEVRGTPAVALTGEGVTLTTPEAISPDGTRIAAVGPDQRIALYPATGGAPQPVRAIEPGEIPLRWSADGRALFVWRRGEAPARIYEVRLDDGRRSLWKEMMPPDPVGVHEILRIVVSQDGQAYAYSYTRDLSTLYRISGAN